MQESYIEFNIIANLNFPISIANSDSLIQLYEEENSSNKVKIFWINFKSSRLLEAIEQENSGIKKKVEEILDKDFKLMESNRISDNDFSSHDKENIISYFLLISKAFQNPTISNLINAELITNFFSELSIVLPSKPPNFQNNDLEINTNMDHNAIEINNLKIYSNSNITNSIPSSIEPFNILNAIKQGNLNLNLNLNLSYFRCIKKDNNSFYRICYYIYLEKIIEGDHIRSYICFLDELSSIFLNNDKSMLNYSDYLNMRGLRLNNIQPPDDYKWIDTIIMFLNLLISFPQEYDQKLALYLGILLNPELDSILIKLLRRLLALNITYNHINKMHFFMEYPEFKDVKSTRDFLTNQVLNPLSPISELEIQLIPAITSITLIVYDCEINEVYKLESNRSIYKPESGMHFEIREEYACSSILKISDTNFSILYYQDDAKILSEKESNFFNNNKNINYDLQNKDHNIAHSQGISSNMFPKIYNKNQIDSFENKDNLIVNDAYSPNIENSMEINNNHRKNKYEDLKRLKEGELKNNPEIIQSAQTIQAIQKNPRNKSSFRLY